MSKECLSRKDDKQSQEIDGLQDSEKEVWLEPTNTIMLHKGKLFDEATT